MNRNYMPSFGIEEKKNKQTQKFQKAELNDKKKKRIVS